MDMVSRFCLSRKGWLAIAGFQITRLAAGFTVADQWAQTNIKIREEKEAKFSIF